MSDYGGFLVNSQIAGTSIDQLDLRFSPTLTVPMSQLVRGLGLEPVRAFAESLPTTIGVTENAPSGYSTWGSPMGTAAREFNRIGFYVTPGTGTSAGVPTLARIRVFQNGPNGTVLADRVIATPYRNETHVLWVDLGMVVPEGITPFAMHRHNTSVGVMRINPRTTYNTPTYAGYLRDNNVSMSAISYTQPGGAQECEYYAYGMGPIEAYTENGTVQNTPQNITTNNAFSGWETAVGTHRDRNRATFALGWTNIEALPTSFRIILRHGGRAGRIVADRTIPADWIQQGSPGPNTLIPPGVCIPVVVDLEERTSWDWASIVADGFFCFRKLADGTFPTPTYDQTRYATNKSLRNLSWSNSGPQYCFWTYSELVDHADAGGVQAVDLRNAMRAASNPPPKILLPPTICAVEGRECSVYADNVIHTPNGLEAERVYGIDFSHSGSLGEQQGGQNQPSRYALTPTSGQAGNSTLSLNVYDRGVLVASGSAPMITKALTAGNGVTRKLLVIGDSTSRAHLWQAEMLNRFAADVMSVALLGTQTSTVNDANSNARLVASEAYNGRDAAWFVSSQSPFWNGSAISVTSYMATNGYTMGANDWVWIILGINAILSASTDEICRTAIGAERTALDTLISSIRAYSGNPRIGLMMPIPPSRDQDAFGRSGQYGAGQTRSQYRRNLDRYLEHHVAYYNTPANIALKTYVLGWGHGLDTRYGMEAETSAANQYVATNITRQSNGVHPAASGYYQLGGTVGFPTLKCFEV